ncbi:MAG: cytochrome b561 domain-containing protein [Pseudomonadota bacterium]
MTEKMSHIPEEVYLGFLGRTIDIHWNYHAILMVGIWVFLVPVCVTIIRFFKPRPSEFGLRRKVHISHPEWWWFNVHKYGLYTAVFLSLAGVVVAMVVSKGFSGSIHATFGILTVVMGCLQVVSGMLRGTHGGKFYNKAKPDNPDTWRGDHYDRTFRRRMFEAYHKTTGYFTLFCALGAVGSGLMQYPMPILAWIVFIFPFALLAAWVLLEFLERRYDGYRAVHGYGLEHPYNKEREYL